MPSASECARCGGLIQAGERHACERLICSTCGRPGRIEGARGTMRIWTPVCLCSPADPTWEPPAFQAWRKAPQPARDAVIESLRRSADAEDRVAMTCDAAAPLAIQMRAEVAAARTAAALLAEVAGS